MAKTSNPKPSSYFKYIDNYELNDLDKFNYVHMSDQNASCIIRRFRSHNRHHLCIPFFEKYEQYHHNDITHHVLQTLINAVNIDDIDHIIEKYSYIKNNTLCITLMSKYGKNGNMEKAVEYFNNCKTDITAYTVMISLYGKKFDLYNALKYFDMVGKQKYKYTATLFNTIISAFGKCGRRDLALSYFGRMMDEKIYIEPRIAIETIKKAITNDKTEEEGI